MNVQSYITEKKELYELLLAFIDGSLDQSIFSNLIEIINTQIINNKDEFELFLQLINTIANDHRRSSNFFTKIKQILFVINENIKHTYSNIEIFTIFQKSKNILLFLFENETVIVDEFIFNKILNQLPASLYIDRGFMEIDKEEEEEEVECYFDDDDNNKKEEEFINKSFAYFFYPEIKKFLKDEKRKKIEKELENILGESWNKEFKEKREIGENDSYICHLIRQDSVEEFISYINIHNISPSSQIKQSIFETNIILDTDSITFIEYALFFGSIQIIQYLLFNNVELKRTSWIYAIHSRNPDLIHLLEEKHVKPPYRKYENCLGESIMCHHNEIASYIYDNYIEENENSINYFYMNILSYSFHFYNYFFIPTEMNNRNIFLYLCQFNYYNLVKLFLDNNEIDVNQNINKCTLLHLVARRNHQKILKLLLLQKGVKIGFECFICCYQLTEISIPSSVTSIGDYAFYKCSSLTQITIPSSVTSIGYYAFYGCSSLTQITIPSSVTSIGYYAFYGCSSLTQITIPSSVTSIGYYAFSECSSLTQISIPPSVTSIGDSAFSECSSLTQISIPSSVTSIGDSAFSECSSLTQISIPPSVTSIGDSAFSECSSLTQISIPSSFNAHQTGIGSKVNVIYVT
ncbi:hypothetical protein M9Y10_024940 [Tritrichomonas musculus]|uniref:Uncharacterized protein n=1 Tax=Tritrichomonas musculus TaxID=1915356 RepID=A0ABR2HBT3_9EUKA